MLKVLIAIVLAASASPQSTHVLENSDTKLTFRSVSTTGEFWLESVQPKPITTGVGIDMLPIEPWALELLVDPHIACITDTDLHEVEIVGPGDFASLRSFSLSLSTVGSDKILEAKWEGTVGFAGSLDVSGCSPAYSSNTSLEIIATWTIGASSGDVAAAAISVEILNPTRTPYVIGRVRFPRVEVSTLDPSGEDGGDYLALPVLGGYLYGDPIDYYDGAAGRGYSFHAAAPEAWPGDPACAEPLAWSLPVSCYYQDDGERNLFYAATDDLDGYVKSIYWTPLPAQEAEDGALRYEVGQVPTGDVFAATTYVSPYSVLIAATQGDWVDAAKRYKQVYVADTSRYLGPVASSANTRIPSDLKTKPQFGRIVPNGSGYCPPDFDVGDLGSLGSSPSDSAAVALDYFYTLLSDGFPMALFDRFAIDPRDEVFQGGASGPLYVASTGTSMQQVHQLVSDAELMHGTHVCIHGITEKLQNPTGIPCFTPGPDYCLGSLYCCDIDPNWRQMSWENVSISQWDGIPFSSGGSYTQHVGCPDGLADSSLGALTQLCGSSGTNVGAKEWPTWFSTFLAEATSSLGNTGGLGFNEPGPVPLYCFSTEHAHDPGFGNWAAAGWGQMMDDYRADSSVPDDAPIIMETSSAFWSPWVTVQNAWSAYGAFDALNTLEDVGTLDYFFDAPIYKIPFMQMVADDVVYASQYDTEPCSMPFISNSNELQCPSVTSVARDYFEYFPSVTASLQAWGQAKRVLMHQSSVLFFNEEMLDAGLLNNPSTGGTAAERATAYAASDMMEYYRALCDFLAGTSPDGHPIAEYFRGALERNVAVDILSHTETFVLDGDVNVSTGPDVPAFPKLVMGLDAFGTCSLTPSYPDGYDIDLSKYRPFYAPLFDHKARSNTIAPVAPEQQETWLPHGVYRHSSGSSFALLMSNPWLPRHIPSGTPGTSDPRMNPFTFDYSGATTVSNTYAYQFTIDSNDYGAGAYTYYIKRRVYDINGSYTTLSTLGPYTNSTTVSGTLAPGESVICELTTTP
jgi:hypothetical protein